MTRTEYYGDLNLESHLRPNQTAVAIILEDDVLTGQADIRQALFLALEDERVVVAQPNPPLTDWHIQRNVDVSLLPRNRSKSKLIRLGWTARILSIEDDYNLDNKGLNVKPVSAVSLSLPEGSLQIMKTIRQDYRLDATRFPCLSMSVRPWLASIRLLDFSAGGFSLGVELPCRYHVSQEIFFKLGFKDLADIPLRHIEGEAIIIRKDVRKDEGQAILGLKVARLKPEAEQAWPKIISHYMREEIKNRKSERGDLE
jgi:hypothetical protein